MREEGSAGSVAMYGKGGQQQGRGVGVGKDRAEDGVGGGMG